VEDGRLRLALPAAAVHPRDLDMTHALLAAHGLDAALNVVPDDIALALRPVRSDLRETTFVADPT
jgi:hypothetical protein